MNLPISSIILILKPAKANIKLHISYYCVEFVKATVSNIKQYTLNKSNMPNNWTSDKSLHWF